LRFLPAVVASLVAVVAIACGGSGEGQESPALRASSLTTPEATASSSQQSGPPAYCLPAEYDALQDIETTPSSPYFVQHPHTGGPSTPTVIFMPGGSGSRTIAKRVWSNYLSSGEEAGLFRLVIPYSDTQTLIDEGTRVFGIIDEVLACYGGDQSQVHIAGTSNGGLAAFALTLASPERFASLLDAPSAFTTLNSRTIADALESAPEGFRVFNGVSEVDIGWMSGVKVTHDQLVEIGVDSTYLEFAEQSHQLRQEYDESVFFEFWAGE
jgi:pimeloyl-ACP methyl ester carboxylesterase